MIEFSHEVVDFAREQLGSAREKTKSIKIQLDYATKTEKVWEDFVLFTSKKWFIHSLDLFDKQWPTLQKAAGANPGLLTILDNARLAAKSGADDVIRRYPAYLEESFREARLPLDADSRHPRYTIERKFFLLEIDEKKRIARLSDNEGRLVELPADIGAIVETVQREHKRIFGRSFKGIEFLRLIRMQYLAIIRKEKQIDGASIPIRRITSRLGKNLKGFRTDEFLSDLSRLIEQGPFEIDGRRLDLQQTKDTNQGMLLHTASGRGYIGFVVFKEV
ncbi:hypothetical protein CY91_04675 [Dehalococcoides mccartyi]|uniref:hypothetical protein n=1 Tax=Dehalococcoides mccartyi TaxID=61435 RepID=UPI00071CBEB3|nr:hypothetical protein [Dehalococcoides mccartyi]KSV16597.1 hypothetical protein CY91_04675 [Dehalococcoides mccartyi]